MPTSADTLERSVEPPAHWLVQVPPLAVFGLAVLTLLIAPFQAWRWYRAPFVGALFEPNHVVSLIDGPGWAAKAAGVDWPARLVAVDGAPIAPSADGLARLARPLGQPVALTLEGRDTGATFTVTVPTTAPGFFDLAGLFLVPYAVALVFAALGLWVYALRWRTRAGRVYLIFCSALTMMTGAFLDMNSTHVLARLWAGSVPLAGTALAALALVFPRDTRWIRRWPTTRLLVWVPGIAAIAWTEWQLYNGADAWAYIPSWINNYIVIAVGMLLFFALLTYRLRRSGSAVVRQQSRVIVFGGLLAFGPAFVLYLLPTVLGPEPARFLPIIYFPAFVIFPLSVAYAILRYRIPEMDRWLQRQVAYGILTAGLVGAYFVLLAALSAVLGERLPANDPLLIALALLAMVLLFNPLRTAAQTLVDRLFYRGRADYGRALQSFAKELTTTIELNPVLERLLGQLAATLVPERALVYLFDEAAQAYVPHGPGGTVEGPSFDQDGLLAMRLRMVKGPLSLTPDSAGGGVPFGEWRQLAELRLVLLAPLQAEGRLTGWLALGPKRSGEPYGEDDVEYAATLASQSALAVENARLYVTLRRNYQRTVEMKNLLDDTFASIASGVVVVDPAGLVTNINAAARRCLNVAGDSVLGKAYGELLPGQAAALRQLVTLAGAGDTPLTGEPLSAEVPGRGLVHLTLSASPLKDANQNTIGVTLVLDDQTDRRRLEAERERLRQTFGRVVTPRVRDKLMSEPPNLAGVRQVVTTLFADVRGFTTLSEHTRPETLFELLNEHLNLAAQAVLAHEGTIDKFLGDAVMALFNAPDPQPDHTLRAVRAALDMQARLAEHRATRGQEPAVHFGVAITVGEAIVGNVGTPELFNYTAIGDVVNLAKRLQELAAPGQILLSEAAYGLVREHVTTRPLPPVQVKGRVALEQIYEVLPPDARETGRMSLPAQAETPR